MIHTRTLCACLGMTVGLTLALTGTVHAEQTSIKEDVKKVGTDLGMAARKVGETGKEVGKKVAETAVDAAQATRDGARKVVHNVKTGMNKSDTSQSASSSAPNLHAK